MLEKRRQVEGLANALSQETRKRETRKRGIGSSAGGRLDGN